jgi:DNA-binding NarL/FixJ family response regulator
MSGLATKILIIDAHPVYSVKLEGFLRGLTYENIYLASTGKEALENIGSINPGLVIMSGILPDVNVFELCKKIKDNHTQTKIIIQIGLFFAKDDIERFSENGADVVLARKEKDLNPLQDALTTLCP